LPGQQQLDNQVMVEPINPFANKELTTEQRIVLKQKGKQTLKQNKMAENLQKQGLEALYKAYEKVGNDLRAAETLELLNEIYPSIHNYNQIGVLFLVQVMTKKH
jgi:molecular chaperone DnaK